MKRIITVLLAAILLLSLSCLAFADSTLTIGNSSADVTATYTAAESYTVSIPASATIGGASLKVTANTKNIKTENSLKLTISSSNYDYENSCWRAYNENSTESIKYYISYGGQNINPGSQAIQIAQSEDLMELYFAFNAATNDVHPGTYTDSVKFNISISAAS